MAYYSAACVANMRLKSFARRTLRSFKDPGPYNVIIMRPITDRVTRAKSDTNGFAQALCGKFIRNDRTIILKYEITVADRRYLACLRAMFENW